MGRRLSVQSALSNDLESDESDCHSDNGPSPPRRSQSTEYRSDRRQSDDSLDETSIFSHHSLRRQSKVLC